MLSAELSADHHSLGVRFGLRPQLIIAMGVLAMLVATVAATAVLNLRNVQENISQTIEVEGKLNQLASDVAIKTQICRLFEKDFFLNIGKPTLRDSNLLEWHNAATNLDAAINAFGLATMTDGDHEQARQWHIQLVNYRKAFAQVENSIKLGQNPTTESALQLFNQYKSDIQSLTNSAQTRAELKARRAQRAQATMMESMSSNMRLLLVISTVALVLAVAWCLLFPIHLMRPIAVLQAATSRLAGGDLASRVNLKRGDELGVLGRRFDEMAEMIEQRTCAIESQHQRANAARIEAEAARAEIADQLATIDAQRDVIREMSVPVLPLSQSALVLPLVGALDSERLALVQEQALRAIEQVSARFLILDITGVPIIDTAVAQGLIQVVQAGRLLGAEVVLVGIRPEVAQAVVGLGIHLNAIVTRSTLQSGIAYVLARSDGTRMAHTLAG